MDVVKEYDDWLGATEVVDHDGNAFYQPRPRRLCPSLRTAYSGSASKQYRDVV